MATLSTNIRTDAAGLTARVSAATTAFFAAFGKALVNWSEKDRRVRHFNALIVKSDAELAELGLKREDIGRHVFGDIFYT